MPKYVTNHKKKNSYINKMEIAIVIILYIYPHNRYFPNLSIVT